MEKKNTIGWKDVKAKVRKGVKAPWYELEVVDKTGKVRKLVAKEVDKFLSESWEEGAEL